LVFTRAGYHVCLFDVVPGATDLALKAIKEGLELLHQNNLLRGNTVEHCLSLISVATELSEALKGAYYAQECAPEHVDLKKKVFGSIDEVVEPATIVASSTSNIPASKFTETLKHRANYLVVHPTNPPHAVPLVELVPAPWTDKEVVAKARALMEEVGQEPVVLNKEIKGFMINRLQYALLAEAFRLVEDDIASPEDVDKVVWAGLGKRWSFLGPFGVVDLNHQKGLQELEEVYLPGIYEVLATQDNRKYKQETFDKVRESWRKKYPIDEIHKMGHWRNARLIALAKHQNDCEKIDKEMKK